MDNRHLVLNLQLPLKCLNILKILQKLDVNISNSIFVVQMSLRQRSATNFRFGLLDEYGRYVWRLLVFAADTCNCLLIYKLSVIYASLLYSLLSYRQKVHNVVLPVGNRRRRDLAGHCRLLWTLLSYFAVYCVLNDV